MCGTSPATLRPPVTTAVSRPRVMIERNEGGVVEYETVAEAYRDLEQASGRLALTDRLATLLAETPAGMLPTVC